jgi:hypothetical protein
MFFPEVEHILDVKRFEAEAAVISDDPLRPLSVAAPLVERIVVWLDGTCPAAVLKADRQPVDWTDNKTLVHNSNLFILDLLCLGCVRSSIIQLETLETVLGTGQK